MGDDIRRDNSRFSFSSVISLKVGSFEFSYGLISTSLYLSGHKSAGNVKATLKYWPVTGTSGLSYPSSPLMPSKLGKLDNRARTAEMLPPAEEPPTMRPASQGLQGSRLEVGEAVRPAQSRTLKESRIQVGNTFSGQSLRRQ